MVIIIGRKHYNSEKMRMLGSKGLFKNGNYLGSRMLMIASDNRLFVLQNATGLSRKFEDGIYEFNNSQLELSDFDFDDDQLAKMVKLGLLDVIE